MTQQPLNLDPIEVITTEVHPDGTVSALLKVSLRDYERLLSSRGLEGQYSIAGSTEAHAQAEMAHLQDIIDGRIVSARLPLVEPTTTDPERCSCWHTARQHKGHCQATVGYHDDQGAHRLQCDCVRFSPTTQEGS